MQGVIMGQNGWRSWFGGPKPSGVQWAKYRIPHERTNHHFLAAGATGSGKTTLLRMLMRSVVPDVADVKENVRVLLFDPKAQWNTELVDLGLERYRRILNPFDARSVSWAIASDITGEADAQELASLMFPQVEGENRFFYDAGRKLLKAVTLAFIKLSRTGRLPRKWELRDILLACSNLADLSTILANAELPTDSLEDFLTAEREARSVRMTVAVANEAYNAIAAAWHNTKESVSLDQWVKGNEIWLLGASKKYRNVVAAFNRLILQRLQQLTLDEFETDGRTGRRSWFVLDEFPSLGRLPHFEELLTEGRERGVCVVLGFQHIAHVRELYRGVTEALLGQCHHQAFFKSNDLEMADWCSKRFPPLVDYLEGTHHIQRQTDSVIPSDFLELPSANAADGFACIVRTDDKIASGPRRVAVTPALGPPRLAPVARGDEVRALFKRRPASELELTAWGPEEREQLGLPEKQSKSTGVAIPDAVGGNPKLASWDDVPF